MPSLVLTGDINLMGVSDPAVPFARVGDELRAADVRFANLECCFYQAEHERGHGEEGFYAAPATAEALALAGFDVVGNANNVNFGAAAIRASLARLDALGIAHTGAGVDAASAAAPAIVERDGVRYGFLQRTCVYWSRGHAAGDGQPGVATLKAHTAYRPRIEDSKTLTRPGMAPEVLTFADRDALAQYRRDIEALRAHCDIAVASLHWGLAGDVLDYQREIAHAAIEAGADLVFGHGPHAPLPFEYYRGKPIAYGVGSFSFETGHGARKHPDWLGLMVTAAVEGGQIVDLSFRPVRHTASNQTVFRDPGDERDQLAGLEAHGRGVRFEFDRQRVRVLPSAEVS